MTHVWRALLLALLALPALAEPVPAGDAGLRHDVLLLADAGVLSAPFAGWPISSSDLDALRTATELPPHLEAARRRIMSGTGHSRRLVAEVGAINRDFSLRGFESVPREDTEARVGVDWRKDRYSVVLRMAYVSDPEDDRQWRADGSQAGVYLGNWWLGASATDRWWGPGWDGSLILSNNARPVPALVLQRERSLPFESRWLSWIGPWTTQVVWGQLEGNRDRGNARLFAWRVGARPLSWFEIGLSRSAQWCGSGRPCSESTFFDLLSGVRDNRGENIDIDDEPGNQLAGFDGRATFDLFGRSWSAYGQRIGEDERNGLPSANLYVLGLSTWGASETGSSYRAHLEFAETSCGGLTGGDPIFGCAYEHSIYTDGYRYRGRSIGHSQDGDGRVFSAGLVWHTAADTQWRATARSGELNRDSRPRNAAAGVKTDILDLEVSHERTLPLGTLKLGVGAARRDALGESETWYGRAFLSLEMTLAGR